MPCGPATRVEESRLMLASSASLATPQSLGRFRVCHASLHDDAAGTGTASDQHNHRDESLKAVRDSQCEQLHLAVGILDSLPWCRAGQTPTAAAPVLASCEPIPELAEDNAGEDAACGLGDGREPGGDPAAGQDGTLTAQLARSISQLRMSASSSNLLSMDCRCCCGDDACHDCGLWEPLQPPEEPGQPPPGPQPDEASDRAGDGGCGGGCDSGDAASHLEPPWSHASCCQSSSRRPGSPTSLRQLAASHRAERVGPTLSRSSASFRRRPSSSAAHPPPAPDCCPALPPAQDPRQLTYQQYLEQLNERIQLWLMGAADDLQEPGGGSAFGPADCGCGCCYSGSPDSSRDGATVTAAAAAAYCHGNWAAAAPAESKHWPAE